jgi:4-hydroxy-tetrahydrodipicolinate synthase
MSTPDTDLRGIFPIVYTPFTATGQIDEDDVSRLVNYLIAAGTHGLSAVGGASECHKMPVAERKWLAELVISAAAGRVPVIVGTSATNTADAIELSQHAETIGAKAVFLTPPLFGVATPDTLMHHYGAVAQSVSIPIMIQDAQVSIPPGQQVALAEAFPSIRYSKEEAPLETGHRITELQRLRPALNILSGGARLLEDLARGAQGAIPGSLGCADLSLAYNRFVAGDHIAARAAFDHFTPLSFWRQPFPLLGTKEVLRRLGIFKAAHLREPANDYLDDQDHRELSAIMERMGPPF